MRAEHCTGLDWTVTASNGQKSRYVIDLIHLSTNCHFIRPAAKEQSI